MMQTAHSLAQGQLLIASQKIFLRYTVLIDTGGCKNMSDGDTMLMNNIFNNSVYFVVEKRKNFLSPGAYGKLHGGKALKTVGSDRWTWPCCFDGKVC